LCLGMIIPKRGIVANTGKKKTEEKKKDLAEEKTKKQPRKEKTIDVKIVTGKEVQGKLWVMGKKGLLPKGEKDGLKSHVTSLKSNN